MTAFYNPASLALPLSPGDRLEVSIPNEPYFSRAYEVNQNGELEVPYLGSIKVAALEPHEVSEKLSAALINNGFFPPDTLQLSVQILQWAPIQIIVPAAGRFQPELMRPSLITPPGIKVFVSNLTVPASSNSTSAVGNDEEGITFPYGARFSQAAIAINCAGGTKAINAHRKAVLVRVNRLTGETTYLDRSVEDLLHNSHNDEDNPFLMPRDGVACYDSTLTNTRDVLKTPPTSTKKEMLFGCY